MATITLTVRGKRGKSTRSLSMSERVAAQKLARGKFADALVWPVPVPVFDKGDEAKALRTRYYFDAIGEADTMLDTIASAISAGHKLVVVVESGAVLTGDADNNVFANVVAGSMLREVCEVAEDVKVEAGAEDPRDYIEE
jgi:hypothetical protein